MGTTRAREHDKDIFLERKTEYMCSDHISCDQRLCCCVCVCVHCVLCIYSADHYECLRCMGKVQFNNVVRL